MVLSRPYRSILSALALAMLASGPEGHLRRNPEAAPLGICGGGIPLSPNHNYILTPDGRVNIKFHPNEHSVQRLGDFPAFYLYFATLEIAARHTAWVELGRQPVPDDGVIQTPGEWETAAQIPGSTRHINMLYLSPLVYRLPDPPEQTTLDPSIDVCMRPAGVPGTWEFFARETIPTAPDPDAD